MTETKEKPNWRISTWLDLINTKARRDSRVLYCLGDAFLIAQNFFDNQTKRNTSSDWKEVLHSVLLYYYE